MNIIILVWVIMVLLIAAAFLLTTLPLKVQVTLVRLRATVVIRQFPFPRVPVQSLFNRLRLITSTCPDALRAT